MGRHELSTEAYALLEPTLPTNQQKVGAPWSDHRPILNGIFWRLATGCSWRDIPPQYGAWQTIYDRFRYWRYDGTWDRLLKVLQTQLDAEGQIDWNQWGLDGTVIRAHRAAAGARKKGGSMTMSPVTTLLDGRSAASAPKSISLPMPIGVPLDAIVTPGATHESTQVEVIMDQVAIVRASGRVRRRPRRLAADKAYDAQRIRRWVAPTGYPACHPTPAPRRGAQTRTTNWL